MSVEYVTIEAVELCSVGEWKTVLGPVYFSFENLADAVKAANEDPMVQAPRLKLGHFDARFENDGEPAFGRAENLRLSNDGAMIVADFVEVPKWLADAMPSAYPNRSIEGDFQVETPGGKNYSFVLSAVSLLGVALPAVQDLEDLERLFTDGPEKVEIKARAHVVARRSEEPVPDVMARADVESVVSSYYADQTAERQWWWVRSVYTEPNELIVDDDEGSLYRVAFTSDDSGEVTFADPTPVKIQFVDIPAESGAAAERSPTLTFASKAESRPDEKEDVVDPTQIRESLGLAEDASEEDVLAKLVDDGVVSVEEARKHFSIETPEPDPEPDPEENDPDGKPTAEVPEGMSLVDDGVLTDLREKADLGVAARKEQLEAKRDRLLDGAVKAGKIPPARKEHYRTLYDADPDGTRKLIDEVLAAGTVPVDEHGSVPTEDASDDEAHKAYMKQHFPHAVPQEA